MTQSKINPELSRMAANTIRLLSADAIQKANSGHPGLPMGMADCAFVLWSQFLKFNPSDPKWQNRDRFILSAGHGSMLLYSLLHLSGFDVTLEDLKSFRQWKSRTPGHPEIGCLPGVETTTGPLGQGFGNGVGMALAAKMTAEKFNTAENQLFGTHHIFAIVSDGDLMEGISAEAASIAGHLKLGNIVYIYDDNQITIEGSTNITFTESVEDRFKAHGWHTLCIEGHNHDQISTAIAQGIAEKEKPTLIIAKTHIGYGSPNKQDTAGVHGSPLGQEELRAAKLKLGFPEDKEFYVPDEVREIFKKRIGLLKEEYKKWREQYKDWKDKNHELEAVRQTMFDKTIPYALTQELISALPKDAAATRALSGNVMQKIAELFPGFCGGSADLEPSTKTYLKSSASIATDQFNGRNLHYGIREHAMASINNGIALYGGYIPFGSTFLVFSDYMRPPIRLAALMGVQSIYVFTHDSIFVGEDGPTHQPIEQLAALRSIPNLTVMRPADGLETAVCWAAALENQQGPSALILTRQKTPSLPRVDGFNPSDIKKGAYIISNENNEQAELILIATGSEALVALEAQKILEQKGISVRVVSMPCKEIFERQPINYRREVIAENAKGLVVIEAGVSFGWHSYFELPLLMLGIDRFGASAPNQILEEKFGFTGQKIAESAEAFLLKIKK